MKGKKHYREKLFTNFLLSDRAPADNMYRKLNEVLDPQFLYAATAEYYGTHGQKSIDRVVFFKLLFVGNLKNAACSIVPPAFNIRNGLVAILPMSPKK